MKRSRLFGTFFIFLTRSFYYIIEVWNAEYKLFTLYNNLTYLILSSVILYNYFKKIRRPKSSVAYFMFLGGFEPPAFRLGGERSILLSYRNLYLQFCQIPWIM